MMVEQIKGRTRTREGNQLATKFLLTSLVAALALATVPARAAGTLAGTDIDNAASIEYQIGATTLTDTSNTVTVEVAEIVDVSITLQSPQSPVEPGTANEELLFTVTNTGNGDETFALAIDSALSGDDFNPLPSATSIYFDTDGSGDLSAGDTPYDPGMNDPTLAPDESIDVFVVNDIPAGPTDGQIGQSELNAVSLTGTGAPGTVVAGAGTDGVDAVIGNSTGDVAATGEYVISSLDVAFVKSATVSDPFGGNSPVPGAEITYRIEVTLSGSGTATATTVTDLVPANTSYLPGSITLNATALSDAPDADAGQYLTATNEVSVTLGDLTPAAGTQTIEFTVTID